METSLEDVRILVVEDEIDDARFALDAIEDTDVDVEVTPYAERALELVSECPFDGVLLDYRSPRMDGLRFLKEARKRGLGIPIVVFTGQGSEKVKQEALDAGADAYLSKDAWDDEAIRATFKHLTA